MRQSPDLAGGLDAVLVEEIRQGAVAQSIRKRRLLEAASYPMAETAAIISAGGGSLGGGQRRGGRQQFVDAAA